MKRRRSIDMKAPEHGDKIIMACVYVVIGTMALIGALSMAIPDTCHHAPDPTMSTSNK